MNDIQTAVVVPDYRSSANRKSANRTRNSANRNSTRGSTARRTNQQQANNSGLGSAISNILSLVSCAVLIFVVIFAVAQVLNNLNEQQFDDTPIGQAALPEETRVGNAYIGLFIIDALSPQAQTAFDSAAARWSSIVGGTLPEIFGDVLRVGDTICNGNFLVNETDIVVDHLMIAARVGPIDGRSGTLGFAGPCGLDRSGFPIFGQMVFDVADVNDLISDGVLNDVILHEMGHVLGIGTLWDFARQGEIVGNVPINQRLIQDPVLGSVNGQTVVLQTTEQPKFVGTNAIAQFDLTFGGPSPLFVPIEDGTLNGQEIFGNRINGAGSIDGHWDLEPLGNELMTFQIDPRVNNHPLSRISLSSLTDMGYTVDLNGADSFGSNKEDSVGKKNLRGKTYVFANDMGLYLD